MDDPTCDDYFLRDLDGQPYGIAGETQAIEHQLEALRDTAIPVVITGTLYAHVNDKRGLCIVVREIRRADETPVPPPATPMLSTSTHTPQPTQTPSSTPTSTRPPSPTPMPTPTATDLPTLAPATATPLPTDTPQPTPTYTRSPVDSYAWLGEYYANANLQGSPVLTRKEARLDLNWGWGSGSPAGEIPSDSFSARWTGVFFFLPVRHRFLAYADDGVRLYLDGNLIIDEWHEWRDQVYSVDIPISAGGRHFVVVEYREEGGDARVWARWEQLDFFSGWKGEYFNSTTPNDQWVITRSDPQVDFAWEYGSPHNSVVADGFSARWTRGLSLLFGTYRFWVRADDGVRIWLDGTPIVDAWYDGVKEFSTIVEGISAGYHTLRIEYYDRVDRAFVRVWWEYLGSEPGQPLP